MAFRSFASDNHAGIHPQVLDAIVRANSGDAIAYGGDPLTAEAHACFVERFGEGSQVLFTFNGTGGNVVGLSALVSPHHSVLCAATAHIQVDECGAPERFLGSKLIPIPSADGKLSPELVRPYLKGFGDEHHAQPRVISVSQSTEYGTVYSADELHALAELAHSHGMYLHVDGARFANAAASLSLSLQALSRDVGVDVLTFGGTKNGLMMGEAVVFFDKALASDAKYLRKQAMQLSSKMRFVSAQYLALFENDLWLKNAAQANRMAQRLAEKVAQAPGVTVTQKVQANAVFARVPRAIIEPLRKRFYFYVWDEARDEVRWMTSFATTLSDVDAFAAAISKAARGE